MADYWSSRQEAMYKAGEMQVNEYFKKLEKAFNQTKRELQKTVESFYFRYAQENGLSYAAAQKQLDKAEIGELKDFIDLAMQNIGKYNQDVNNMSIKARMTRYQALEAQVDAMLRQLYAVDYQANGEKMMQDVYEDTYSRTWYNIDRYRGFHSNFAQVDTRAVDKLLEYPFNGANFSDRLWKQKDHLQTQLMESLTTMMIQGVPPQNLAADFAKKMQSKKFDAYRLLHTESSFLMSEATHAGYAEDGVEKYQILATLDSKTCGICGDLDGKMYKTEEAVTGVNMPPFHCFCRCTDVPYYDDTDLSDQTRAARDADGKPIEVPADMTYAEWKKEYIDQRDDEADILEYTSSKKHYDEQVKHLAELEKESDDLLDAYMAAMDTPDADRINKLFETKYEETENLRQIVEDLKANLSGKEAKAVRQVEKNLAVMSGIPIDKVKMTGLPYDSAKTVYDSYEKVLNLYPELKGNLSGFTYTKDFTRKAYAACNTLAGNIKAYGSFSNFEKLVQSYAKDVSTGFHPVGTDYRSIIVHELGHALDGYMTKHHLLDGGVNYGIIETSSKTAKSMTLKFCGFDKQEIVTELKNQGLTLFQRRDILEKREADFISKHVSKYASGHDSDGSKLTDFPEREFFAECFAEYVMSDNPRKVATVFGEIIDTALRR